MRGRVTTHEPTPLAPEREIADVEVEWESGRITAVVMTIMAHLNYGAVITTSRYDPARQYV